MPPALDAILDGRMFATVRNPACLIHGSAIVAGISALAEDEKPGARVPRYVVTDGPVVTFANAPGILWMQEQFLL